MLRDNFVDNYLVLVLLIQMCINTPSTLLILALIPSSFWIFMWGPKAEFVLNRGVAYHFKEIFKREEIFAFFWKLAELVKGCY
jgi:hypothetical protein